ncbi:hypothetical protein [Acetobacterium carbinolicum]|uniref:hypothetical protein n=1 Tax=Acetobacterium carbinolicum TaxID=52690 RepID=UPI0039C915DE
MKNDFLGHIDDYYGHFEILYVDGTSDAFYANEELFKKISMLFGGRIILKRVMA